MFSGRRFLIRFIGGSDIAACWETMGVAQPKKLRRRNCSQKPGENLGCTGVERYRLNEETRGGMPGIYMIYMREGVIFTCSTYFHLQA